MARGARLRSESGIYHLMLCRADKQDIFIDNEGKSKMLQIVKEKEQHVAFFVCVKIR